MIETKINELFENFGYRRYKMSKFEPYDFYADNRDFLSASQIITFTDLDGTLLALKPDVTLSIVRSSNGREEKVYYNESVYRPKDAHYRETLQAGVERIGRIDEYSEAEVISLAARALELVSPEYVIRISSIKYLRLVFEALGLSEKTEKEVLGLFEQKNADGLTELVREGKLANEGGERLKKLLSLYLPFEEGVKSLEEMTLSGKGLKHLAYLRRIASVLRAFGVSERVFLDFSLVNSMDYYNGILFQGAVRQIPFPILAGGRYDLLLEKMGKNGGAVGFALDLDAVMNYMPYPRKKDVDGLILYDDSDDPGELADTVSKLIRSGHSIRTVRKDEYETMEHRISALRVLTLDEAGKGLK